MITGNVKRGKVRGQPKIHICLLLLISSTLIQHVYLFDNKGQDLKEQPNFDDKETTAPQVF